MKADLKKIALERIQTLLREAQHNAKKNPELAQRQASLARKISTKHKIRLPYEIRMQFCKKCKSFIAPGVDSKIRVGRSTLKSVRITCRFCHHTYRKVISSPK
ncbi:MAG: RNase P subunit [Nitrososphaera sp.]|jgi:ribonuclease P protein subunit RPR2